MFFVEPVSLPLSLFLPPLSFLFVKGDNMKVGGCLGLIQLGSGEGVGMSAPTETILGSVWVACMYESDMVIISISGFCR